ncbi:MAG: type II 3-dehydroquinate dehydratase [Solirubrobacteraceae bacterium]
MSGAHNRIQVMHGVNLDVLGRRNPEHYGGLSFSELERRISEMGSEMGLQLRFFQSNFEGEFVEELHRVDGLADALLLNPGAWTHYAWAIRDALEVAAVPAVEVHLSDVEGREEWRKVSVIADLCVGRFYGKGLDGYREALERLRQELR